jgi:predicted Zn-dependent protease
MFFILGCAEVPLTHRTSLRLLSQSELLKLSLQQYDKVLNESKLSTDKEKTEMVQRVGERVARGAEAFLKDVGLEDEIKHYQWEFSLIEDDKMINAWCMPGGKVAVYTGILPIAEDENGLAIVMGHEVAHAIAQHGNERMSQNLLTSMGGLALSVALSEKAGQTRDLFMTAYGVGSSVGFLLPYSRVHESEADRIGLVITAMAGYDPREAIPFWQRMNEQGGDRPPEFLSTHPAPSTRIADLKSHVKEALSYYKKSPK